LSWLGITSGLSLALGGNIGDSSVLYRPKIGDSSLVVGVKVCSTSEHSPSVVCVSIIGSKDWSSSCEQPLPASDRTGAERLLVLWLDTGPVFSPVLSGNPLRCLRLSVR